MMPETQNMAVPLFESPEEGVAAQAFRPPRRIHRAEFDSSAGLRKAGLNLSALSLVTNSLMRQPACARLQGLKRRGPRS